MRILCSCCTGESLSIGRCGSLDCLTRCRTICSISTFCTMTTAEISRNTAVSSHAIHHLGLVLRSAKVLLGAINEFIMREPSERPGSTGWGEDIGGGGGLMIPSLRSGKLDWPQRDSTAQSNACQQTFAEVLPALRFERTQNASLVAQLNRRAGPGPS